MYVDGEGDRRADEERDRPSAGGQHVEAVGREQRAGDADHGGHTDTGREELEEEQSESNEQQQIGDRGAGDRVEELVDEAGLREPRHGGGSALDRAVVGDLLLGGLEHDAIAFVAVESVEHVRDRRDAFVGDPLAEHAEGAGVGQPDRAADERVEGVDRRRVGVGDRVGDRGVEVADLGTRGHARHVGDSEQMDGRAK